MKISQMPAAPRLPHRVAAAVPVVEVADDADPQRVRRPDGEVDAAKAFVRRGGGPEPLEVPVVRPLAEQVEVEVGQHRAERVGVDELPRCPSWFSTRSR